MDSTMIQENVTRESIRRENVSNCLIIFVAGIGVVLGLGLIGVFFTYMIHSYELKNFAPALVFTLVIVVIFAWVLVQTYYSRTPLEERPCGCLSYPISGGTPIMDPLIDNIKGANVDDTESEDL